MWFETFGVFRQSKLAYHGCEHQKMENAGPSYLSVKLSIHIHCPNSERHPLKVTFGWGEFGGFRQLKLVHHGYEQGKKRENAG